MRVDEGATFIEKPQTFEEYVIKELANIGPVIAVGQPSEPPSNRRTTQVSG